MSMPLAAFIDNDDEDDQEIAIGFLIILMIKRIIGNVFLITAEQALFFIDGTTNTNPISGAALRRTNGEALPLNFLKNKLPKWSSRNALVPRS